ncbi:MAG: cupin domain-containing protein [Synergistes sp.]|nr:cupin domain-containing protein [Synergistes sp.]
MLTNSSEGVLREKLGGAGKGHAMGFGVAIPDTNGAFTMATRLELAPGATISYHKHATNEEVYFIMSGEGLYTEDGETVTVKAGDIMLCRKGHSHSLDNTSNIPLVVCAAIATRE